MGWILRRQGRALACDSETFVWAMRFALAIASAKIAAKFE
jgi:hypothetical protein